MNERARGIVKDPVPVIRAGGEAPDEEREMLGGVRAELRCSHGETLWMLQVEG